MAQREQSAEIRVAAAIDRQQEHRVRAKRQLGAEQRYQPVRVRVAIEANREIEVVAVCQRECLIPAFERGLNECFGRGEPEQQRAVRAHAQRDERAHRVLPCAARRRPPRAISRRA
jgi:hypothetical protein